MSPDTTEREKQLSANITTLLEHIAENSRPCQACGVQLWFVRHQNGKLAPYTYDAINHFVNCAEAARFRKGKK
jgi:hypothetical protein